MVDACLATEREALMSVLGDTFRVERARFGGEIEASETPRDILSVMCSHKYVLCTETAQAFQTRCDGNGFRRRGRRYSQFYRLPIAGQMAVVVATADDVEKR